MAAKARIPAKVMAVARPTALLKSSLRFERRRAWSSSPSFFFNFHSHACESVSTITLSTASAIGLPRAATTSTSCPKNRPSLVRDHFRKFSWSMRASPACARSNPRAISRRPARCRNVSRLGPIASTRSHLKKIKRLVKRTNTPWLSDHLCWGSVDGRYTRTTSFPFPTLVQAAHHVAQRIRRSPRLSRNFPSWWRTSGSYAEFHASE